MLVLSRKTGERIHIGGDVTVEVRRVAGNRVTLAVEAPREVRILRGELRESVVSFEEPADAKTAPTTAVEFGDVAQGVATPETELLTITVAAGATA